MCQNAEVLLGFSDENQKCLILGAFTEIVCFQERKIIPTFGNLQKPSMWKIHEP